MKARLLFFLSLASCTASFQLASADHLPPVDSVGSTLKAPGGTKLNPQELSLAHIDQPKQVTTPIPMDKSVPTLKMKIVKESGVREEKLISKDKLLGRKATANEAVTKEVADKAGKEAAVKAAKEAAAKVAKEAVAKATREGLSKAAKELAANDPKSSGPKANSDLLKNRVDRLSTQLFPGPQDDKKKTFEKDLKALQDTLSTRDAKNKQLKALLAAKAHDKVNGPIKDIFGQLHDDEDEHQEIDEEEEQHRYGEEDLPHVSLHPSQSEPHIPIYPSHGDQHIPSYPTHGDQHIPSYPSHGDQHIPSYPSHGDQHIPTHPSHGNQHIPSRPSHADPRIPSHPSHDDQHIPSHLSPGSFSIPGLPENEIKVPKEDHNGISRVENEQKREEGITKSGRLSSDDLVFKFKRIEANIEDILHDVMAQYIERYQVLMKFKDQLAVQDARVLELQMTLEQTRNETIKRIQTESLQFLFDTSKLMEEKRQLEDQIEFLYKSRNHEVNVCRTNNKRIGELIENLEAAQKNRMLNIKNSIRALESAIALS